jgi:succinyl-CoA:(S)-malate CoA-transferase subunit B
VIDPALYEGIFRILDEVAPCYQKTGLVRQLAGAETPIVVPHSHNPSKDARWLAIACTNDKIFARLMGRVDLCKDPRYATNAARIARRGEVNGIVADWTSSLNRDDVLAQCAAGEVPCGPVHSIDEIFLDPQYAARGAILNVSDPRLSEALAAPNVVSRRAVAWRAFGKRSEEANSNSQSAGPRFEPLCAHHRTAPAPSNGDRRA